MKNKLALIVLSAVLSALFLFGAAPARAAGKPAAKIGRRSYASFEKAVKAVKKDQTIKLQKNCKVKKGVNITKKKNNYTVDLKGHKLYTKKNSWLYISQKYSNVTFKNGKIVGNLEFRNGGKLTLDHVKLTGYIMGNDMVVTLKNSTITPADKEKTNAIVYSVTSNKKSKNKLSIKNSTVNGNILSYMTDIRVENSTISAQQPFRLSGGSLVFLSGKVNAKGGKNPNISTQQATAIEMYDGVDLIIKDGTFTSKYRLIWSESDKDNVNSITINGGTFTTNAGCIRQSSYYGTVKLAITGGEFNAGSAGSNDNYVIDNDNGTVYITGAKMNAARDTAIKSSNGSVSVFSTEITASGYYADGISVTRGTLIVGQGCVIHSRTHHAVYVVPGVSYDVKKAEKLSTDSSEVEAFGYPNHYNK